MKRQLAITLGAALATILLLSFVKYRQISAAIAEGQNRQMPPAAVTSFIARAEQWPQTYSAIASLEAVEGATLAAEDDGRVAAVHFQSGDPVTAGQLLVELDTSVEQAQLAGAKAQLELAARTAKRQRTLRKKKANSQTDLDTAESNLRNLAAEVSRLEAVIARRQIVAPYDGNAGIRRVNVGEMISVGTEVVAVHNFKSLHVNFTLPQDAVPLVEEGASVIVAVGQAKVEYKAVVTAIDSAVDPVTRNISVQATLDNAAGKLRPGMFAVATIMTTVVDDVVVIPESSVAFAPFGDRVFVIAAGDGPRDITPRTVQLGRRHGDLISVTSGIAAGDEVASSGTFKLFPGVKVIVNNSVQPGEDTAPTPADT